MTALPTKSNSPDRIGLIAGQGRLPILVALGAQQTGVRVHCIGLAGQYDPALPALCTTFSEAGIASLGKWIRVLRRHGVCDSVLVGRVAQKTKYQRFLWLRYPPDWRAIRLWYGTLRKDRRTATVLSALAAEMQRSGIRLMDSRTYIGEHLAHSGSITQLAPSAALNADIAFGWPLFEQLLSLKVGQAMAVLNRDVLAVEAAEGTDAMIARAGELSKGRPWALLKSCASDHDMRADVPTVGIATIQRLHAAGCRAAAMGAGRVILLNKVDLVREADRLGVALLGIEL